MEHFLDLFKRFAHSFRREEKINPIGILKAIVKEIAGNKDRYVAEPQKDFSRNRKVTFYDIM